MARSSTRQKRLALKTPDYGQSIYRNIMAASLPFIASGKHTGVQRILAVAASVRAFGKSSKDLPQLQSYAETAADGLDRFGEYIDRTELPDIFDDLGTYAKHQPVLVAALTLGTGIALTQAVRNWRENTTRYSRRPRSTGRRNKASGRRRKR